MPADRAFAIVESSESESIRQQLSSASSASGECGKSWLIAEPQCDVMGSFIVVEGRARRASKDKPGLKPGKGCSAGFDSCYGARDFILRGTNFLTERGDAPADFGLCGCGVHRRAGTVLEARYRLNSARVTRRTRDESLVAPRRPREISSSRNRREVPISAASSGRLSNRLSFLSAAIASPRLFVVVNIFTPRGCHIPWPRERLHLTPCGSF